MKTNFQIQKLIKVECFESGKAQPYNLSNQNAKYASNLISLSNFML